MTSELTTRLPDRFVEAGTNFEFTCTVVLGRNVSFRFPLETFGYIGKV